MAASVTPFTHLLKPSGGKDLCQFSDSLEANRGWRVTAQFQPKLFSEANIPNTWSIATLYLEPSFESLWETLVSFTVFAHCSDISLLQSKLQSVVCITVHQIPFTE